MSCRCCDFTKKNEIIATCSGLFNSTNAKCAHTNVRDFVCCIQDCPMEEGKEAEK